MGAFLVQGYHLGTDDAEVYIPAINQFLNPKLYPAEPAFFGLHARLAHLPLLVGAVARALHISADGAVFLAYLFGTFLLVLAGWRMAGALFTSERARWGAVAVLALIQTVPVAGTGIPIADAYLTARTLSTPFSLMALACFVRGSKMRVLFWLILTGLLHPQMAVYTAGVLILLSMPAAWTPELGTVSARAALAFIAPPVFTSFSLQPAEGAYRDVLYSRTYFFLLLWRWWEWVGVAAPLAILYWFTRIRLRAVSPQFQRVARALILFGLVSTAVELVFSLSARFDSLQRLQPMRSFQLIYIVFFLMCGGLLAEYVLQKRVWRWALLFVPLAAGMFAMNRSLYPASPHIELPGRPSSNAWVASFLWIRANTPTDALFALNPRYMHLPGEDTHGFRAIAERGRLADYYKDSGEVTMFPQLVGDWERDQQALQGWDRFTLADFEHLRRERGVSWVVLDRSVAGLPCPYRNGAVRVCQFPQSP